MPYALVVLSFWLENDQPNLWPQREHRWANRTTLLDTVAHVQLHLWHLLLPHHSVIIKNERKH